MKKRLRRLLLQSAHKWAPLPSFEIERPKVASHGELSANLAMILAKKLGRKPQEVAQELIQSIQDPDRLIEQATVAGAGFINFTLSKQAWQQSLKEVIPSGDRWGRSGASQGEKAVVEFVSANPTGPLHIGNARGGPLGDTIAALLEAIGYEVMREYYVNDVGGQIDKLGASLLYWIQNDLNRDAALPEGYQGDYVYELAALAQRKFGQKIAEWDQKEAGQFGIDEMMREIKRDCEEMGIRFDSWVHEKEILDSGKTEKILEELKKKRMTLEKEGALWLTMGVVRGREDSPPDFSEPSGFASGERIDRESVLVRSDGRPTYFANDIAYHVDKYYRKFDRIINIWGSNHHGHIPRLQAAMKSLGLDPNKMETVLYQYVRVKRGEEAVKMSKRGGNFVTAREVLDEVGRDAFRFFLLMRAPESHLDFDIELARRPTQENPVYYVQYAHARLAAIERKAAELKISPPSTPQVRLELLQLPEEIELIRLLNEYPEEVERAALRLEPHRIPFYLLELTKHFQAYYTKAKEDPRYKVLSPDIDTSQAKMYLCAALKLTLSQGLKLIGVSAPEVMVQET